MSNNETALVALNEAKENFALVMKEAQSLDIVNNVAGAFDAAIVITKLRAVMTDDIMQQVFMPLQGQKIGFRTDKNYPVDTVRNCIIDGAANGLLPTGNQFNIIAGNMYPTKEGYTALLAKLKASPMKLVYSFEFDAEATAKSSDPNYVAIPCKISYKTASEEMKGAFRYIAMVKSNGDTSTTDQLRGKAERKAKKAFYEFLTGIDLGDADVEDAQATVISTTMNKPESPVHSALELARKINGKKEEPQQDSAASGTEPNEGTIMQPNAEFDKGAAAFYENNQYTGD